MAWRDGYNDCLERTAAKELWEELVKIEAKVSTAMPAKHDDLTAVSVTFTGADLAKICALIAKAIGK